MKLLISTLTAFAMLVSGNIAHATDQNPAERFVDGTHFAVLPYAMPTSSPGIIEVREIFWYGSAHSYQLQPILEQWFKGTSNDVDFIRTPAMFNSQMQVGAQAFFVFQSMNLDEVLHAQVYMAIHRERKSAINKTTYSDILVTQGFPMEMFDTAYDSRSVNFGLQQAHSIVESAGIGGLPTIVVAGKYRVTLSQSVSRQNMMQVVDFLVEKERLQNTSR